MKLPTPGAAPHIIVLVAAAMVGSLSMTLILPSLPSIASDYATTEAVAQFTISAYLFAAAIVQLFIGPLADRYGRRNVLLVTLSTYVLATIFCLLAPSIEFLILGRVLQASAISGLVLGRAILRDVYDEKEAASKIAYVTMGMAVGPIIAPAIGGFLNELIGWRAVFYFMLVFSIGVLVLVFFTLAETNKAQFQNLKEQFKQYPELLRARRFWGLSIGAACNTGAYFAFLGSGAFVAYSVLQISPTMLGAFWSLVAIGYVIGNFTSGRLAGTIGTDIMPLIGNSVSFCASLLGAALMFFGVIHPLAVFGPLALVTMGNGMTLPSLMAGIVSVRPHLAGSASGLGGTIQQGGGALMSVLAGFLVTHFTQNYTLFLVMMATTLVGQICLLYVVHRKRRLQRQGSIPG